MDKHTIQAHTSVNMSDLQLDSTDTKNHPNASPFSGTLLLLDEPSNQPPHGADGHLIHVSTEVAEKTLKSLPGMAINYDSDLEGHNPQKKIGVITEAWIDGKEAKVKGLIWKKDFPEAMTEFRRNKGKLGMSMELGNVYVADKDNPIWDLKDFHFTGATILKKDHAAYEHTAMAASRHFINAMACAKDALSNFEEGDPATLQSSVRSGIEIGVHRALRNKSFRQR
jgi:hypothetical protein